jgi:hypothetical protein
VSEKHCNPARIGQLLFPKSTVDRVSIPESAPTG